MSNLPTKVTDSEKRIDETDLRRKAAASKGQIPKDMDSNAPLGSLKNPYKLGEKGSGIRSQGAVQDFYRLRKKYNEAGMLFEDPEFPAEDSSIFNGEKTSLFQEGDIIWKRPKDLVKNPQLYVKGISRFDVKQGHIGDCWMVSSLANLAMNEKLVYQVVPMDQSFEKYYAGIFHFRFWKCGKWVEVVIDDRLPTYKGDFVSIRSQDKNEFWASLVEKAFAKLHGSYINLEGGFNNEALEDFTGGISRFFIIQYLPSNFFDILHESQFETTLIGCGIVKPQEGAAITDKILEKHGLVAEHAYSITKIMYYEKTMGKQVERIPLIRVRNPWGIKFEWNGAWSEKSSEWKSIPEDKREELGFVAAPDGEFWISFEDWKKYFTVCQICYLKSSLETMFDESEINSSSKNWYEKFLYGEWVIGSSAGGSITDLEKFQHNPQYIITIEEKSKIIVGLMQKNRRANRAKVDDKILIGFHIYELPEKSANGLPKPLDLNFFKTNEPLTSNEIFDPKIQSEFPNLPLREVTRRTELQPGSYCIIVSTFSTNKAIEYFLRVYSEKPIEIEEYDVEVNFDPFQKIVFENSIFDEDEVISKNVFRKLAGDDWEFDWKEEKELLNNKLCKGVSDEGFSDDFCRSMVMLLDDDDSGKIGYNEFKKFWCQVKIWKAIFKKYDENCLGKLKKFQLREALKNAGFNLNNQILNILQRRYGDENGHVKFQDYIMCAVRLKKMIGTFNEVDSGEMNSANVTLEKWIKMVSNFG